MMKFTKHVSFSKTLLTHSNCHFHSGFFAYAVPLLISYCILILKNTVPVLMLCMCKLSYGEI